MEIRIYCPNCEEQIATHNSRSKLNHIARCRKCNKRIVYHVDTGETEIKDMPLRNTSSGRKFI